jgi:hypothetical protein
MKNRLALFALLLFPVTILAQVPVKRVLMEEFTTVLCGVCPPVTYNIHQYHQANPNTILVTIHEGFGIDGMSNSVSTSVYNAFKPSWGSFAPAIMIDRTIYPSVDSLYAYMPVNGFDTLADAAQLTPGIVDIQISSQYMPGIGGLISQVTAVFYDPLPPGNYRVNLFLVEDSVTGYGYPQFAQKCYDANFVAQHYAGYPYANDTISGYPHRYVLRETLTGNAFGTFQTTPALTPGQAPVLNTPYVYTMPSPFIIPFNYNFDRLYLVASVNKYQQGLTSGNEVINAFQVKLSDNISTGLDSEISGQAIRISPNPGNGNFEISLTCKQTSYVKLRLSDLAGRNAVEKNSFVQSGENRIRFDADHLPQGSYILNIEGLDNRLYVPVIIIK